jgi:hypothetical protein
MWKFNNQHHNRHIRYNTEWEEEKKEEIISISLWRFSIMLKLIFNVCNWHSLIIYFCWERYTFAYKIPIQSSPYFQNILSYHIEIFKYRVYFVFFFSEIGNVCRDIIICHIDWIIMVNIAKSCTINSLVALIWLMHRFQIFPLSHLIL